MSGLSSAGEVVLYNWTEWLKEQQHLWAPAPEPEHDQTNHVESDAQLAAALQQVLHFLSMINLALLSFLSMMKLSW